MKKFEKFKLSKEEISDVLGGISYCDFIGVVNYLGDGNRNQIDQSVILMQKFNRGEMQLSDWDYNGNPPAC
ncbi:hypothetical protein [Marinifilum sp. D737]|uniref:hypothetical protein n=1 Tax=Marinifilum sp. D737 TaxID=2969628 RepID=UPI0022751694|nr:hypothetical protein [Marinifilum sp. D737]MCY1634601.1 hypothetical protein [Marinifilum sp. D737]